MIAKIKNFLSRGSQRSLIVKKNIIASLLIKGCSIIVSLLLVPLTLDYVSSEMYGIWLTLSSIMLWLNFFDVGFTLGLKNRLAEAIAIKDWNRGKALVSTTYFMMVVIFVPLCLLLELLIPHLNWASFLNVDSSYNADISQALYVLVACFCLQMIVNVLLAVVAAFQKVALSMLFPVIGNILSLIVIVILTKCCPPSLTSLAFAISSMPIIVVSIASFCLFKGVFEKVSPSFNAIDKKRVKDLFGLGVKFFLIQIQVVVFFQTTNILISNVSGPDDVTAYNIAYKYLSIGMMVYSIILNPLWPAFTDAYAKKDFAWMNGIYAKMKKLYFMSALVIVIMMVASPIVYSLWIGEKADISFIMTLAVGSYMILNTWDALQVQLINGIGAIKLQTYVTMIGLFLHIPMALFLGRYLGAVGVVSSMFLIVAIYSTFFTLQINKILKRKAGGIWIK